jgi:hypothetical protein
MTILLSIVILVLVAIICYLCEANQRLAQRTHNNTRAYRFAQDKLYDMAENPPVRYIQIVNGEGYHDIYAQYANSSALVKRFMDGDEEYNQICAEELLDKLSE